MQPFQNNLPPQGAIPQDLPPQQLTQNPMDYPYMAGGEMNVANIVDQIDPQQIIDNFNHALKGEYFNKEIGKWVPAGAGAALVNDQCRGWIISYLTAIMNKASTLGTINEKQFSGLMEGIIRNVTREFACNLEKFGFVPPGPGFVNGEYFNVGIPDSARMDTIAEAVYQRAFLIYSRSLSGMESRKIFSSLSMSDPMMFGQQQPKQNWMSGMFGR